MEIQTGDASAEFAIVIMNVTKSFIGKILIGHRKSNRP